VISMVEIQSKEVIDKISDELKIQPALQIPRELGKNIQLTYDLNSGRNPKVSALGATVSDGTTATIHTTDLNKRTFMVGCSIAMSKDVVATSVHTSIVATVKDLTQQSFLRVRYEPVTAGQFNDNIVFDFPIELEPGTTVTITNTTAIASIDSTGILYFYETDPQ